MNRRQLLSLSALSISLSLSGCIESTSETLSREGETPECWPSMCEGTKLVEVVVEYGFSGDVVLKAECRAEEFSIPSGESVQIARDEDAESCNITLSVNGEQVVNEYIEDYEMVTLTVRSNGDVDDEWIVY